VQSDSGPRRSLNRPLALRIVGAIGAAAVFALCGAWSSGLYSDRGTEASFLGVPFALLCTLLMVRKGTALLILPAIAVLWPIARFAATGAAMVSGDDYWPMGLGGLIGGWGIAVAIGIAHRQILSRWRLAGAAAIGYVAGLSFGPWLTYYRLRINSVPDHLQPTRLRYAFAIWQAAVGTYVLANVMAQRKQQVLTNGSGINGAHGAHH
jgi:hypothetical protein